MDKSGSAEAEAAIRNVLARIAHLSDMGDIEEYGAQFTEDARWEMSGVPVKEGRARIQEAGVARRAEGATGPGSDTRHVVGTTAVTVDGDTAVAESYWQFYADTATAPVLRSMGHYRDTFRRTPEGWRLAERLISGG
ncbi:nuclear transport factor 2 family protein [Actinomadura sp. DC4]|uniref:nuclear transport factor 2 family protein n=1 Tax=Actinomadura sp. DC4 TaxID=3055069 RepID=UPI0025B2455A|nr:nuclear transport factor 2 family protein [Actinomadura sp. DC4]MDN3357614.1 nuclear transport factor 2 family protein [Actinomadura sp. DC4]